MPDEGGCPCCQVGDFGLARFVGEDGYVHLSQPTGTQGYMAPELARGGPCMADTKADVFSLGAVCLDMVRGPSQSDRWGLSGAIATAEDILAHLPVDCDPTLHHLIVWCCQPDPSERPSWEQILTLLDDPIGDDDDDDDDDDEGHDTGDGTSHSDGGAYRSNHSSHDREDGAPHSEDGAKQSDSGNCDIDGGAYHSNCGSFEREDSAPGYPQGIDGCCYYCEGRRIGYGWAISPPLGSTR
jgi:serine/threonine protein kinase